MSPCQLTTFYLHKHQYSAACFYLAVSQGMRKAALQGITKFTNYEELFYYRSQWSTEANI